MYRTQSVQDFRFALSEQIRQQVFYAIFVEKVEAGLVQRGFFLPCTEYLKLFRENCAEKQTPAAIFLIRRCNECLHCPSAKKHSGHCAAIWCGAAKGLK